MESEYLYKISIDNHFETEDVNVLGLINNIYRSKYVT